MTAADPEWNWIGDVVAWAAHDALLAGVGGLAGIHDVHAMQFALARPRDLFAYGTPDVAGLAAAYAYGVLRNHPFLDGHKRTGYALALVFLLDNGWSFIGSDIELVETMLAVAAGSLSEDDLAEWFRARVRVF